MTEEFRKDKPTIPEAAEKRPPDFLQCAKELYSLPEDWRWFSLENKGEGVAEYLLLKGGVYKTTIARGPRKGATNFKKPEPGTACDIALPQRTYDEWIAKWEKDTGLCHRCKGTGWAWAGWSKVEGDRFRPCKRCDHSGKAVRS